MYYFIFAVFLFCVICMFSFVIKYKKKNAHLIYCLEKQERYIKGVLKEVDEIKKFRHDVKHHMNILSIYINNGEYETAKSYILRINGVIEYSKVNVYTGIIGVDAIIDEMFRNMDKNIELIWHGNISKYKKIDVFDMCILFSNIISNAIEACDKCVNKKYIKIIIYEYNDVICVYEENTHGGNIRTDEKGKIVTSKNDNINHGLGIKNVSNIVKKYNGKIRIFYDENFFKLSIVM